MDKVLEQIKSEVKKPSYRLLSMQESELLDQLETPHQMPLNLYRLTRYKKGALNAEKLVDSWNKALRHHPVLCTVIHKNEDGSFCQMYRPELFVPVTLEKKTEEEMKAIIPTLVQPFEFFDHLLIKARVIETETYLYNFSNVHHCVWDGTSAWIMEHTMECYYLDKPVPQDHFYAFLEEVENTMNTPKYEEYRKMYIEKFGTGQPSGGPKKDPEQSGIKGATFYKYKIDGLAEKLVEKFKDNDPLYNNFFCLASICAIAKITETNDIMITWTYHGRDSQFNKYSTCNYLRMYPIRVKIPEKWSVKALFAEVVKQAKELKSIPYVPYTIFNKVDIMNVMYQKQIKNYIPKFAGVVKEDVPLPALDFSDVDFSDIIVDAQYYLTEEGLLVEWEYPFSKMKVSTVDKFKEIFSKFCFKLLEKIDSEEEEDIMKIID